LQTEEKKEMAQHCSQGKESSCPEEKWREKEVGSETPERRSAYLAKSRKYHL